MKNRFFVTEGVIIILNILSVLSILTGGVGLIRTIVAVFAESVEFQSGGFWRDLFLALGLCLTAAFIRFFVELLEILMGIYDNTRKD